MKIGEAAEVAGLPVKTLRYYADIGLVEVDRTEAGYRDYDQAALSKLIFVAGMIARTVRLWTIWAD